MQSLRYDCCAVIASYNPSRHLIENIQRLRAQLGHVFLVDNGSCAAAQDVVSAIEGIDGCTLIRFPTNRGIASALNAGVRIAREQEFEWIFTFDQDSSITADFVESMLRTVATAERKDNIAVVTPQCLDRNFYFPMKLPVSAAGEILETITSGSMIPSSVFGRVGEFDENLFMDYVDIEFCLRCRRAGFRIVQSSESVLYHSLGKMTPHHIGSLTFYPSNHSAQRHYYMTRNRVYLIMRYLTDWQWVLHQLRLTAAEMVKVLLWEKNRLRKLMRVVQGIFDAIFGRMGKRVEL